MSRAFLWDRSSRLCFVRPPVATATLAVFVVCLRASTGIFALSSLWFARPLIYSPGLCATTNDDGKFAFQTWPGRGVTSQTWGTWSLSHTVWDTGSLLLGLTKTHTRLHTSNSHKRTRTPTHIRTRTRAHTHKRTRTRTCTHKRTHRNSQTNTRAHAGKQKHTLANKYTHTIKQIHTH